MALAGVLLAAYLLGSFPTSYVVVYRLTGRDIRTMGTGNPGAMNVLESVGAIPAVIVALGDVLKAMAAVGLAYAFDLGDLGAVLTAFAAVIGHDYSVFLRLDGGNGTAAGIGGATMLLPIPALVAFAMGCGVGVAVRNRRIGGLVGMATYPLTATIIESPPTKLYGGIALIVLALLQIVRDEGFHFSPARTRPPR